MPVKPFKFQSGKPKTEISKYRKDIENKILPVLEKDYGVKFSNPREQTTLLTYRGRGEDGLMSIQFSSNNPTSKDNEVFVTLYDNGTLGGEDVGNINMNNIDNAIADIENVWASLNILTLEDKKLEKMKAEKEKRNKEEKEKQALLDKRKRLEDDLNKEDESDNEEDINTDADDEDTFSEDLDTFKQDFDAAFNYLRSNNQLGGYMLFDFLVLSEVENRKYDVSNPSIQMVYVTEKQCVMETQKFKPAKKDANMSWDEAKQYLFKAIDKLKSVPILYLYDMKGNEVDLNKLKPSNDEPDIELDI